MDDISPVVMNLYSVKLFHLMETKELVNDLAHNLGIEDKIIEQLVHPATLV